MKFHRMMSTLLQFIVLLVMKIMSISRRISVVQRMWWRLQRSGISRRLCLLQVLHHMELLRSCRRRQLCLLLILHTVSLSWWQRRFMRSGRMTMRLIVSSLLFVWVWYSERVRMVISLDCIGLYVVISLLTQVERIPSRLVSM